MSPKIFYYLIVLLYSQINAQSTTEYFVMDQSTKQPVKFVSVYHKDSLVGYTNDLGIIYLKDNLEYLYKKDLYLDKTSIEKNIYLERLNESFTLDEIIINKPKNVTKKQIGHTEAFSFPLSNLEFITFVSPKKNETNKSLYRIVFPFRYHKTTQNSDNIYKLTVYSATLEKIYSDYITLSKENDEIEFKITKDLKFENKGLFIGFEKIKNPNEKESYDILLAFDLYQNNLTYYSRNYLITNKFETFEQIEMEDQFSQFYKTFPEPVINKFKNISPVFTIELF